MQQTKSKQLVLPALRARMGDWVYYVTFMKMKDIAERINIAQEIHQSRSLNEFIQRQLEAPRTTHIKNYLLTQPERFFNALVVGVYHGSPNWYELAIQTEKLKKVVGLNDVPLYIEGSLGILALDGSEKLFAIDGQHRVVGIRKAVEAKSDIGDEEVSAIFVAHSEDPSGLKRTRRLFTTLNRHAKPVSKYDVIALDEDDVVAVVTRRLVDEFPLFGDKLSSSKGKNLPVKDQHSFTSIVALYDALKIFLRPSKGGRKKSKMAWPDEGMIKENYKKAEELFDIMTSYFTPLQELKDSDPKDEVAAKYRHKDGGHLLFRPIGIILIIKVVRLLVDSGIALEEAVSRVSKVPMDIAAQPWAGLFWDVVNKRMITSPENQKVAMSLLFFAVGGNLSTIKINEQDLRQELAGLLKKELSEVRLVKFV